MEGKVNTTIFSMISKRGMADITLLTPYRTLENTHIAPIDLRGINMETRRLYSGLLV